MDSNSPLAKRAQIYNDIVHKYIPELKYAEYNAAKRTATVWGPTVLRFAPSAAKFGLAGAIVAVWWYEVPAIVKYLPVIGARYREQQ